MEKLQVACLQMRSTDNVGENVQTVEHYIKQAAESNVRLLATPEMTSLIDNRPNSLFQKATTEDKDPMLQMVMHMAKKHNIAVLIGSLAIEVGDHQYVNRSYFINETGNILQRYDKIHMFDVCLSETESYKESAKFVAGTKMRLTQLDGLNLGLTICYDVRFPYLYRDLAQAGADIIFVPAAFANTTGKMHWHALLRARAIETGCFIVAPAQGGIHQGERLTYGHSLIVNPWGEIQAELTHQEPGLLLSTLHKQEVAIARKRMPAIHHSVQYEK